MIDETREQRRAVIIRYARLLPSGKPVFCNPSQWERYGASPRRQGAGSDGKPIYDSRESAETAGRELEALGAWPLRAFLCRRSGSGHYHLTTDNERKKAMNR